MRRLLTPAAIAVGLFTIHLLAPAGPAMALPAQDPSPPAAQQVTPGEPVCEITDERLREVSGLVATADGYVVVNDSTEIDSNERVFFLDSSCEVANAVQYPTPPLDPEDLAISPDGQTLWIADVGDNPTADERRERIALWSLPADGSAQPVIHRVSYPDGPHDAEALLIANDGTPLIITKETGPSGLYRPVEQLRSDNDDPVPMERVGELELPTTSTPNLFAAAGRLTVTGAARSPDGSRIALRTYADAFEWDLPADGDIVKTLTTERPRATPLTDPFGESIAYSPDGAAFLTVSDVATLDEETPVEILRYTPSTEVAAEADDTGGGGDRDGPSWLNRISLQEINLLIAAVGVLGALLVGLGIFGIVRARRTARSAAIGGRGGGRADRDPDRSDREPGDRDRAAAYASDSLGSGAYASGALGSGALPGGGPAPAGRKAGGVYGAAKPAAGSAAPAAPTGPGGGGVYGGAAARPPAGGGTYGAAKPATGGRAGVYGAAAPRPDTGGYRPAGGVDSGAVYGAAKPAPPARPSGGGVYGGAGHSGRSRNPGDARDSGGSWDLGGDYPGDGYPADRYDQPRAGGPRPPAGHVEREPGVYGRSASEHPDEWRG
ncbi:hypothetical protein O7621_15740 [Solwaraspora sp. WMMD937]|uniref:hypothetical protein n=1 Tax=Solwaraspora sp. WMMD937 TaxID=3016090 RepID=UPI00249BAF61|nr:hypothetical protein [Solwaraspora sp. WMMD937]WFE19406.1 hypothetical protein O7621_15740 [Solwaraspora sp. WMMD937]